jgi:predicted phosphodiesterase
MSTDHALMKATIAHVSDLHLSNADAWENFKALKADILELDPKPSLIIASGDFLDHPDSGFVPAAQEIFRGLFGREPPKNLASVRKELDALCKQCGDICRLIVVPGNHDCRQFGLTAWKNHTPEFDKVFPGWRDSLILLQEVRPVAIFCLDSNTNDARINAARGCVGKEEFLRFRSEFDKLRQSNPTVFDQAFKIVVLHHHPLPIADAEEAGYFATDGFLGLDDAGVFMREMAAREIDLVLHGHKHYTFNARIEVTAGSLVRDLTILAAGSACKSGQGENSFNVITIEPRAVSTQLWVRTKGASFFARSSFSILSYEKFRDWAYLSFESDPATKHVSDRLVLSYSVLEYGDCDVTYERRGLRCSSQSAMESFPVRVECPHGTVADYRPLKTSDHMVDIDFKPGAETKDGLVSGIITFDPPLDSQTKPIDFEESYRLYNAFALTREQRCRMSGSDRPERVGARFKNPVRELVICVHFAKVDLPSNIRPAVHGKDLDNPDLDELHWCQPNLHVSKLTKTVTLTVSKPLRRLTYGIEWDLPPDSRSQLSALHQGQCDEIRGRLLELDTKNLTLNPLQPLFADEHRRLSAEYHTPVEKLHLGLMVYDPQIGSLRYVAGMVQEAFWHYRLCEGQGIAGRAHKLKCALIYVPRRIPPRMAFAAAPPARHVQPEILICVPLRFPVSQTENDVAGEVIGVITLSTTYQASELLKIDEDENLQKAMPLEFQILFLKRILPALGLGRFIDSSTAK